MYQYSTRPLMGKLNFHICLISWFYPTDENNMVYSNLTTLILTKRSVFCLNENLYIFLNYRVFL